MLGLGFLYCPNNNSGRCPLTNANLEDKFSVVYFSTSELLGIARLEDKFSVVHFSTSELLGIACLKDKFSVVYQFHF